MTYNGGVLGLDNIEVSDCELLLGPNAHRNPDKEEELVTKFRWNKVIRE